MTDKFFIDSNVWIYLFGEEDSEKKIISRRFILENAKNSRFVIQFQVINEVCRVLKKKDFTEKKLRFVIDSLVKICEIHESTIELSLKASELREEHGFSFWDSHIVAHAIDAQSTLISEDMQNNRKIHGTTIKNIFKK